MKRLILAAAVVFAGAISLGDGPGNYWVVGNRATGKCDIVTSNPVIGAPADDGGTGYSFGDGPYKSRDDAKLARSTIGVCPTPPKEEDSADK
jgi:hypothetical protein